MHMVTFAIVIFELVILFFQLFYFLERPSDQQRRWYLILLCLLISYNVAGGLFPDASIPIPIVFQNILAYGTAVAVSMFLAFYLYKAFDLKHLKRFALYGPFLFILLPFVVMFIVPYILTGKLALAQKLIVFIPGIYGFVFLCALSISLKKKYAGLDPSQRGLIFKEQAIYAYLGLVFWLSLPVITYYNLGQVWEVVMTNAGFITMTIAYVRFSVLRSKTEFNRLQTLNSEFEKQVRAQTIELERANEQRTTNFVNLAHETKTPLTLIQNYLADYIAKYGVNEELSVIRYNVEKLITDIVNYFDIERLEKGIDIYDHDQTANLSGILTNSLSLFKPLAANKTIQLVDDLEESVLVQADPDALVRIVNNIVENAIKYTGAEGRISVVLYTKANKAVFIVSDSGKGIPKHLRSKVLHPYFQVSQKKRGSEGIGMGLSIVNKIVESLSGTIELTSNTAKGLMVKISFPLKVGGDQTVNIALPEIGQSKILLDETPVQDAVGDAQRPSILVVEDHISMLRYLTNKLSREYNVYAAQSGREGLQKLQQLERLDLIISDIMMDNVDGFKFGEIVKRNPKYSHVPLLYLTAKARSANEMASLKLGALGFIEKPFKLPVLLQKVQSVIENSRSINRALIGQIQSGLRLNHSNRQLHSYPSGDRVEAANDLMSRSVDLTDSCKKYDLSNKEIEVVELLENGYTNKEIGLQLNISDKTVMTHVRNIFAKVGVNRRGDVIKKLNEEA
ncbi:MAG: ATP-binding protein [Cyclobacteriaceae bacterium]